jgi:hypothetical protein
MIRQYREKQYLKKTVHASCRRNWLMHALPPPPPGHQPVSQRCHGQLSPVNYLSISSLWEIGIEVSQMSLLSGMWSMAKIPTAAQKRGLLKQSFSMGSTIQILWNGQ